MPRPFPLSQSLTSVLLIAGLLCLPHAVSAASQASNPVRDSDRSGQLSGPLSGGTTDHTKLKALQGPFNSAIEASEACLECHTEAAHQVKQSTHWSWEFEGDPGDQLKGKRHVINNFCGNVVSNEVRCTSCHVGIGWDDIRMSPDEQNVQVDCLICHDQSGQYTRINDGAGHPPLAPVAPGTKTITGADAWPVDLALAARSVGLPSRQNCLQCHAYGGGGDNVKHGDISSALITPDRHVDVHMDADGLNFACTACHVSDQHITAGSRYEVHASSRSDPDPLPGQRRDVATCESCHGGSPHDRSVTGIRLDTHAERIACQTCHIPSYARGGVAAKTLWDLSTAGKLRDGKPYAEKGYVQGDGQPRKTYVSQKGDFEFGENLVPMYAWFDGQIDYTTRQVQVEPGKVVEINGFTGTPGTADSRIWPFRIMQGRQPYDDVRMNLVATQVYGPGTESAFWENFDWNASINHAMAYAGEPYSGSYDFIDTRMYWPITHMVAPADEALDCESCHVRNGRLEGIEGVYMPGRGYAPATLIGLFIFLSAITGVFIHLGIRLMTRSKSHSHD